MEIWDLYTELREVTGKEHIRGEEIPEGYYHLVVHVWIKNKKGEYLISQRSEDRPAFPLMWECVGGSALKGEDMIIDFRQATIDDAGLLVDIYNASFFSDYQRFGVCPGYGKTIDMMEESIRSYPKYIILCDNKPVGCVSCHPGEPQEYEIGCLCVIPEYQGQGIGTQAVRFVQDHYDDWKRLTLVTPLYKRENVRFYTERCGFQIIGIEKDGNVELARFVLER